MNEQFTKGPWGKYITRPHISSVSGIWIQSVGINANKPLIANAFGNCEEQAIANANLIAAAPIMYNELDALIEYFEKLLTHEKTPMWMFPSINQRISFIKDILSKANPKK